MLRDGRVEVVPTWAESVAAQGGESDASFREVDRQLRRLAKQKGRLEIEEAKWLREAERLCVWRNLGFSTALEYLEDVFGYAPRTAMERLRVAKDLGELPTLEEQVKSGAMPWSAARELTRVMTPENEAAWLERAHGRNLRDIELLVSGHKKGDDPDAPADPDLMTRTLLLKLVPRVDALWQQMRRLFEDERGEHIDEVELFEAVCMRALEVSSSAGDSTEAAARAKDKAPKPVHRIVTHTCDECLRGWREGRGRLVEVPRTDIELARCDAEVVRAVQAAELAETSGVGGMDAASRHAGVPRTKDGKVRTKRRPPPTLTIPKATRDFVWQRDQGRCRVPGCRATRHLTFHHLVFLSEGGDHDPENLILICDGHHKVLHNRRLVITGRAPDRLTFVRDGALLVDARSSTEHEAAAKLRDEGAQIGRKGVPAPSTRSRFNDVVKIEQVKQALIQLKFQARAARAAAEAACAHVGVDADVGVLVKTALELERGSVAQGSAQQVTNASGLASHVAEAKQALVQLGYAPAIAGAAVQAARAHVGGDADLVTVIKEALRRCTTT